MDFAFFLAETTVAYGLPAVPRLLTGVAEWLSCLSLVILLKNRLPAWSTGLLMALALPAQLVLRCVAVGELAQPLFQFLMVMNLIFMALCIGGLCRLSPPSVLFWWSVAFMQAELMASLSWQLSYYLFEAPSLLSPGVALFNLAVLLAVGGLVQWILRRTAMEEQHWWIALSSAVVVVLTYLASNINVFNSAVWWDASGDLRSFVGWIRTLADLCGMVIQLLLVFFAQEQRMMREVGEMNGMMEAQYRQYLDFQANSAYIARQCHDLKHQVEALRGAYTSQEWEGYLTEMEDAIDRYHAQCNTGNPVLNSLLTQKVLLCQEKGIRLTYTANGAALGALAVRDICVLFGNLLDNAIEHVAQYPDAAHRQVVLEVARRNGFLYIGVENCCEESPVFQDGLPQTTKADRQAHGLGTKSIVRTVEQYDGNCQFSVEDGWFYSRILIPLRPEAAT